MKCKKCLCFELWRNQTIFDINLTCKLVFPVVASGPQGWEQLGGVPRPGRGRERRGNLQIRHNYKHNYKHKYKLKYKGGRTPWNCATITNINTNTNSFNSIQFCEDIFMLFFTSFVVNLFLKNDFGSVAVLQHSQRWEGKGENL